MARERVELERSIGDARLLLADDRVDRGVDRRGRLTPAQLPNPEEPGRPWSSGSGAGAFRPARDRRPERNRGDVTAGGLTRCRPATSKQSLSDAVGPSIAQRSSAKPTRSAPVQARQALRRGRFAHDAPRDPNTGAWLKAPVEHVRIEVDFAGPFDRVRLGVHPHPLKHRPICATRGSPPP